MAPLPKGAEGAKEARPCEPTRTGARQGPAAASSCQRSCPAAAAGLRAAGTGNGQREGWLEPRTSPDNVLRKHEGCDEESARWRVQGALDQAGRQRAAASACATQGELAGRTCAGEAFCRPFHVLVAAEKEVGLPHGQQPPGLRLGQQAFVSDSRPSSRTATAFTHIKKKTSCSFSLASLRERLSYVSLRDADPSQRPDFS